jgi:tRNA(Ile)-lysidine synthase
MALLDVMARLRQGLGFVLSAHSVNHGLRREAAAEVELCRELCRELGVPFSCSELSLNDGSNLQARARQARYRVLREHAQKLETRFIATAHHAEDRAETVLMRVLRGAGVDGLGVMPARDGDLLRPMIRASRLDVDNHLSRHQIAFAEDASNQDPRFLRVRVRNQLMPLLCQLSPQIVKHLTDLADQVIVGDVPQITDPAGNRVALGRAQITQLRRILQRRQLDASVALAGGASIRLDPSSGEPIVEVAAEVPRGEPQGQKN